MRASPEGTISPSTVAAVVTVTNADHTTAPTISTAIRTSESAPRRDGPISSSTASRER
jgi:hypothetical protein